ncbi:PepSY-like domain-containing protein [uncultured Duncaniella sp.]|uniref:PepSY-like domain-containing protein n=1 Tax=uncultured Duncaniella sp. TaxID=2768039 RepID=UPI0026159D34|nr:PepSY-like domain-containing protein [uncultured Duncaniella sp.]
MIIGIQVKLVIVHLAVSIAKYVDTNFKGQIIVEISRKRGGYEVELSNGSELKLTEDAKPMQPRQGGRGQRR